MSFFTDLKTWHEQSLEPAVALRPFTVLLGVSSHHAGPLEQLLAELDATTSPEYRRVLGLHNLRWILLDPATKAGEAEAPEPEATRLLVLSLVFDCELDDVLADLMARVGDDVHAILRHCQGFAARAADVTGYLKQRAVPAGFLFRDIGPLAPGRLSAQVSDATVGEIRSASKSLNDFARFYALNPPWKYVGKEADLVAAFRAEFDNLPLAQRKLHPLEERQPEEERWVRLASELMIRRQVSVQRRGKDSLIRRSAHAKGHGLIHAKFVVCESKIKVGVFGTRRTFDAVLRPSNSAQGVHHDGKFDARGLAISLILPEEGFPKSFWLRRPGRQDFLLFNSPTFVAPDVQGYVRLLALLDMVERGRKIRHGLRLLGSRRGLRQLWITVRSFLLRPPHPLVPVFHSSSAYSLGDELITKYSVEVADRKAFAGLKRGLGEDFLSAALERSLPQGLVLNFYLHVLPTSGKAALAKETLTRAVEDGTLNWSSLKAEKVKVATIEIGRQSAGPAERAKQAEEWEFNLWNALQEHRPLGSLNRARRVAYEDSAALRRSRSNTSASASVLMSSLPPTPSAPPSGRPRREDEAAQ